MAHLTQRSSGPSYAEDRRGFIPYANSQDKDVASRFLLVADAHHTVGWTTDDYINWVKIQEEHSTDPLSLYLTCEA